MQAEGGAGWCQAWGMFCKAGSSFEVLTRPGDGVYHIRQSQVSLPPVGLPARKGTPEAVSGMGARWRRGPSHRKCTAVSARMTGSCRCGRWQCVRESDSRQRKARQRDEIPVPGLPCANQVPSEGLGSVISEVASLALAVSEAGLGRKEVL